MRMSYVLKKGTKKFFVGGDGYRHAEICTKNKAHTIDSMDYEGVPGGNIITPHSFKLLKESRDSLCLKAYNLHFDSAKEYIDYGNSTHLTFCFINIDVDGKDELIIFSPYWGTCGFRIYDIRETSRKIQLKSISKEKLDQAIRLLIAPKEGVLLCWWRNCIYKYKILKNAARSIIKLKEVDNVWSEITDLFLSYTIEEPEPSAPKSHLWCELHKEKSQRTNFQFFGIYFCGLRRDSNPQPHA